MLKAIIDFFRGIAIGYKEQAGKDKEAEQASYFAATSTQHTIPSMSELGTYYTVDTEELTIAGIPEVQ